MNNDKSQTIVKGNKYEELFNPNQNFSCQYYTEDEFIIKNRNGDDFLNIFSLNIRSLPKHGGELLNFLGSLKTDFHVIILTEIGWITEFDDCGKNASKLYVSSWNSPQK